ncbi:MAG: SPFH domain-containing protein [Syntrophaceae bacterium]
MDLMTWMVPLAVVFLVLGVLFLIRIGVKYYIKVPPNRAAIFYGKKGSKIIASGAKLRIPILEDVAYLDLNTIPIDLSVENAPNRDGVLVSVKAVANVKIKSDEGSLRLSAERFLGNTAVEIKAVAYKNLEGHLRGIVGRMTVEELVNDRNKVQMETTSEAATDLAKMGMDVDLLVIQQIHDEQGYIEALGKKRTAEVMKDAQIGKAEAESEGLQRASTAERIGQQAANANLAKIAEAEKDKDVLKARYLAEVNTEKAKSEQAGPLAEAEARKNVVEKQVEVQRIQTDKETEVATAEANKREKQLLAEVVKPAEAQKTAAIAKAEGEREAAIKKAEGERETRKLEGEGKAAAILAEGTAEAEVIKLKLFAEAEGVEKKAEAYKKLDERGQLLLILQTAKEVLPELADKLAAVMAAAASPLASVDKINIVDFGSGNGAGALAKLTQVGPELIKQFFTACKETGLDVSWVENLLKAKPEEKKVSA